MMEKIEGIVLDVVRHNERHDVVTLYTAQRGRVAFVTAAGSGRGGCLRRARLQPLALIESDVNFRSNKELQMLGGFSLIRPWRDMYFNPLKSAQVIFLSEFLNRLLREAEADRTLWLFLADSLQVLDNLAEPSAIANFHLTFMGSLLPFVGIQPDAETYTPGSSFDMRAGVFTDSVLPHSDIISAAEAPLVLTVMRLNYHNSRRLRLSGAQRARMLERLLQYYSIHVPGIANMRSPAILRELFS